MSTPVLIAPNLYQLPALKPACNCYLITGGKNTLIDVGIRENYDHLSHQLQELNLSILDINDIIYTHCHYDHTGAGEFFPHSTVYSHPICREKLLYQDDSCIYALKYQIALPTRFPSITIDSNDYYNKGIPALITNSGADGSLIYSIKKLQKYNIQLILPGHGKIDYDGNNTLVKTQENIIKRIQQKNTTTLKEAEKCQLTKY